MTVVYRPARVEDLERADALVVASINDLTERHGFGSIASSNPTNFQAFSLKDDAAGLWVAEDAGEILGFAWSWVCGNLWFLAQLFVSRSHQGSGIGIELLRRTLDHADKSGATNRALITFSFNSVSQGLYLRHGLLPRFPIYNLSVARDVLIGRLQTAHLRHVPLLGSHWQDLAGIDTQALGISREKHHKYLMSDNATSGFGLYKGQDFVGYVYIGANGHIGPLAVVDADLLGIAFKSALNLAARTGSARVSAFVPGTADDVLSLAVEYGMRISLPMVLMATRDLRDWTQYMPRNPGFM